MLSFFVGLSSPRLRGLFLGLVQRQTGKERTFCAHTSSCPLLSHKGLSCGDATRLGAKSHRQNCYAPTNKPTENIRRFFVGLLTCPLRGLFLGLVQRQAGKERIFSAHTASYPLLSHKGLSCGDATRLRAKFLAQNCYAPTNKPTENIRRFLSACSPARCAVFFWAWFNDRQARSGSFPLILRLTPCYDRRGY